MAPVAGVDKEQFLKRLSKLYSAWKDGKEDWENLDAIAIAVGVDEDTVYSKSTAVQTWLFGYELPDTIMVFTKNSVLLLSSKKKIEFLKPAESKEENGNPSVKLLMRDKSDNDKANFQKLITALKESENGKRIGVFSKDKFPGAFMDSWCSSLQKENMEMIDLSTAVAQVLAVKDESELNIMKKAFQVSLDIFTKYLKDQVMDIVDGDRKIRHQKLAEGVESAVSEKKYVSGVDPTQVDMCYPPIIQSGGNYSLKFSAVTDKNVLHFGSIVCCLGARYKSYCSNIVRTLLVNPNDKVKANYNFVCQVEEEILKLLVPGTKLSTVYNKTVEFAKKENPELADKLTKSFGFVIGIEFRERALVIGPKCNCVVMKGMTFTVNIGLSDLKNDSATDDAGKNYALFLGDTVVVADEGPATPLIPSKKKMKSIGIFLKDEESDEEKKRLSIETRLRPAASAHNVEDAYTRLETLLHRYNIHNVDIHEQMSNLNNQIKANDKELDDRNARIHDLMLTCDQLRAELTAKNEESKILELKLKENEEKLSTLEEDCSNENRVRKKAKIHIPAVEGIQVPGNQESAFPAVILDHQDEADVVAPVVVPPNAHLMHIWQWNYYNGDPILPCSAALWSRYVPQHFKTRNPNGYETPTSKILDEAMDMFIVGMTKNKEEFEVHVGNGKKVRSGTRPCDAMRSILRRILGYDLKKIRLTQLTNRPYTLRFKVRKTTEELKSYSELPHGEPPLKSTKDDGSNMNIAELIAAINTNGRYGHYGPGTMWCRSSVCLRRENVTASAVVKYGRHHIHYPMKRFTCCSGIPCFYMAHCGICADEYTPEEESYANHCGRTKDIHNRSCYHMDPKRSNHQNNGKQMKSAAQLRQIIQATPKEDPDFIRQDTCVHFNFEHEEDESKSAFKITILGLADGTPEKNRDKEEEYKMEFGSYQYKGYGRGGLNRRGPM